MRSRWLWLSVFLAAVCVLNVGSSRRSTPVVSQFMKAKEPSPKYVLDCARFYGLSHPEIVVAQSVLETGHYRSSLCHSHNNLFGLYDSSKGCYRRYSCWQQSVKAYKQLVDRKYVKGDYYAFLKRIGYAEDPLYCKKVKRVRKSLSF